MIKVVLFDLDDTLVSELEYVKSGYKKVAEKIYNDFSTEIKPNEIYDKMLNIFIKNRSNVFNKVLDELKITYNQQYIIELVDFYRNHEPTITLFEDVIPTLIRIKNLGIKIGIISDGYEEAQRKKIKALNIDTLFDKILLTDELGKDYWKPNPKAFEIMKNFFNVNYNEIIYIGDNPQKDFGIKKYYPIRTVRIARKNGFYNGKEYLYGIKEDLTVTNLMDLNFEGV